MNKTYASIITIGDELLIGQVIDTNSSWIAQELNKAGILVKNRVAVGDNREDIWQAIDDAMAKSNLVLITGGIRAHRRRYHQTIIMRLFWRENGDGSSYFRPCYLYISAYSKKAND